MFINLNHMKHEVAENTTIADLVNMFHLGDLYPTLNNIPVRGDEYDTVLNEGDSVNFIRTIII